MRLRDMIGLIVALVLAIGVALVTRYFLTKKEMPQHAVEVKQIGLTKIIVAAKTLSEGDKINSGDLAWQLWPQKALNPNYMTEGTVRVEDFVGAIVRVHLNQGEPVTASELAKPGEKGILAAIISPGKRAISIEVTAQSATSGLISPGDYVDVILSKLVATTGSNQQGLGTTVVSNLKVLAIDVELSDTHEKPKSIPHVATLEVTPAEAELIMAAAKEGNLSLSLHGLEKSTQVPITKVTEKKEAPKEEKVILMRGKEKSEVPVHGE